MNTKGYQGGIHKTAVVYTSDPKMARFTLGIRASVQAIISVSPPYVYLKGIAGHEISGSVRVNAGLEKPLFIEPDTFNLEGKVDFKIEEIVKGRSYRIRFTSKQENPGKFWGFLNLKTNYEEKPILNIRIRARFIQGQTNKGK